MRAVQALLLVAYVTWCASIPAALHAQAAPAQTIPDGSVAIGGDVPSPFIFSAADLKQMPRKTVTIMDQGREVKYEGVLAGELLKQAGAPLGPGMGGPAVATYVTASAKDGYQAVYALAEMDPAFTDSDVIVADLVDGKPLFDYQGPLRLVAPKDKRGARSVRMLQRIDVVRLKK